MSRTTSTSWVFRTPLVNGPSTSFTEWFLTDIGNTYNVPPYALTGAGRCFVMGGISTYEGFVHRTQCDYRIAGAVFEDAQSYGLVTDALGPLWDYCENGHGHITDTGVSVTMDGGSRLEDMVVGGDPVVGTSLFINQGFNIRLPKNDSGGAGTVLGSVSAQHTLNANGCLVTRANTITLANVGNVNSYKAMLPVTGCNRMQFGSNAPIDITPDNSGQGDAQGHQTVVEAWHTDRSDLRVKMVCNAPDYANVRTSASFAVRNAKFSKAYINQNSDNVPMAAINFANSTQYSVYLSH